MNKINSFLARFENEPALMRVDQANWLQVCCEMVEGKAEEISKIEAYESFWFPADDYRSIYRPYNVVNGILTIPVMGLLLNNLTVTIGEYVTGYQYIWEAVKRGMADGSVRGIMFRVNSGGGQVSGNFDLVDRIFEFRGKKPMWAYTSDGAYSAAYSIASVTDKIIMGRTAGVGSIGVVTTHIEQSKALEMHGLTANIVRSKPRKYEANSIEPLTKEARDSMQQRVDEMHKQFVAIVARNRGMSEADVDATEALTFMPTEAISLGLADETNPDDAAYTAFEAIFNPEHEDEPVTKSNAEANEATTITEAALAAAVAAATAEGANNERARISAILTSAEAKDRPAAAKVFAFDTDNSAEAVAAMLSKLPAEAAAVAAPAQPHAPVEQGAGAGAQAFKAAMENTPNPNVQGTEEGNGGAEMSRAERAMTLAKGSAK